jgi:hypothetical protein
MHRNQLRPVRERRFDLHFGDHLRDSVHHVLARQNSSAQAHDLSDAFAVAGQFKKVAGDERDGFWVVKFQAARFARMGQSGGDVNEQFVPFLRRQVHGFGDLGDRSVQAGEILMKIPLRG